MAEEGRPTVMTPEVIRILEGAFADGATDKMACFLANISESTFYLYQSENPEFLERKNYLKDEVKFQAKKNIRQAIAQGDLETSKWYAERKIKDEFSPRQELTGDKGEALFKWQDENDNDSVQTEEMGEGVSPEPETLDSSSITPPGGEDDSNP